MTNAHHTDSLSREEREEAMDDAVAAQALQIRNEWNIHVWFTGDATFPWCWEITEDDGYTLADEACRTEDEAWIGLREGVDRESRKAAIAWITQEGKA